MEIQKYLNQPLQVNKEWQPLKSGYIVDNEIVNSFNGDKLNLVSPIVLRENLAYIFTLLGFKNYPDKEEMAIIEDFIRTSYPLYTIQEFRIAFKMAVQGKIDCSTEHYEKFSPKFIGQVMISYTKKANEVRKMLKPIVKEIEPPKLTNEEIILFTQTEWLNSPKIDYNRVFNADKVFNILLKEGKLKIAPEEILDIVRVVKEDNIKKLGKLFGKEHTRYREMISNEDYIDSQCKKLALARYFESLSS